MYLIYSIVFTFGVILTAPYYLWRLRGKITSGAGWRERFGWLPAGLQQDWPGAIWIHAVSVGETIAVAGLVRELQRLYPQRKLGVVVMGNMTDYGVERILSAAANILR